MAKTIVNHSNVKATRRGVKKSVKKTVVKPVAQATTMNESAPRSKTYTNMFAAYRAYWKRGFTDWLGTSSRSEYWWSVLANLIVFGLFVALSYFVFWLQTLGLYGEKTTVFGILVLWYMLVAFLMAAIIPNLSLTVRRLHDAGFSTWWVLLVVVAGWGDLISPIISLVAGIVLFVFMLLPTKVDNNIYHNFNK